MHRAVCVNHNLTLTEEITMSSKFTFLVVVGLIAMLVAAGCMPATAPSAPAPGAHRGARGCSAHCGSGSR
jgi:hypothetical protein